MLMKIIEVLEMEATANEQGIAMTAAQKHQVGWANELARILVARMSPEEATMTEAEPRVQARHEGLEFTS